MNACEGYIYIQFSWTKATIAARESTCVRLRQKVAQSRYINIGTSDGSEIGPPDSNHTLGGDKPN